MDDAALKRQLDALVNVATLVTVKNRMLYQAVMALIATHPAPAAYLEAFDRQMERDIVNDLYITTEAKVAETLDAEREKLTAIVRIICSGGK